MDPAVQVGNERSSKLASAYPMTPEDDRFYSLVNTMIPIVLAAAFIVYIWRHQAGAPGALSVSRNIGMVLAISGFVCWAVARLQLGSSFSIRAKATELVTHGIYSRIRNPVYIFGTIYTTGIILWLGKPLWLIAVFVIIPMQVKRMRRESRVLEAKFGDEYRAYRAKTWF